jgi:cellulose synthase/poly-beta-1,6-N-acetylglucosamine synthase-like glycosyltransferase
LSVSPPPTPLAWRIAAIGALAGGAAIGDRAAGGGLLGRGLLAGMTGVLAAAVPPIVIASRRPPVPPRRPEAVSTGDQPTFSVVIGARDEARVLPLLIADLAAQDHRDAAGSPCFEIVVVDDRSVDGTGAAARAAAEAAGAGSITRVVRREGVGLPDGKGAALTAAQPGICSGDVVVVLDADARVGPSFLSTLAWYVSSGADAVTCRRRIGGAESSRLAAAQADEQTADGEIQRGRWALGGCSEFRGNGIVVRRDLLAEVGGWRAEALTEDLDLSSRVAATTGIRVAWAIDAEVWEEPVRRRIDLWRQRVRWAEGAVRRSFEHGPAVLRSARLTLPARLDFAAYAGQLLAPPMFVGLLAGCLRRRRAGPAAVVGTAYVGAGVALAYDALRWEADAAGAALRPSVRANRALQATLFSAIWLAAVPAAFWRLATRRGAVRYDKMAHG